VLLSYFQIATQNCKMYGSMLVGMEFVAREIHFYRIFEALYLKKQSVAADQLSSILVNAFSKLLKFLADATKFLKEDFFCTSGSFVVGKDC
jgi:hypothetical protein